MKKLPSIYKNTIDVNNNLQTFYSKNEYEKKDNDKKQKNKPSTIKEQTISEKIKTIFANKSYSYTKKVRIKVHGKVYETRFISENGGKILTIDNEIIAVSDIETIEILS